MNPFTLLVVLGISAWSLIGIIWFIGSFIFVGSLALVTARKTYHAISAAIRKNQPERRDEPSLTPKRGGSECRPVAQFSLRRAVRFNPTLLAVGLVALCGCERGSYDTRQITHHAVSIGYKLAKQGMTEKQAHEFIDSTIPGHATCKGPEFKLD